MRAPLLLSLLLLALPSPAAADRCPRGQVAIDGGCCWPGQSFDAALGCLGLPQCPDGLSPVGQTCARLTQSTPERSAVPAPAPAPATPAPATPAPATPAPATPAPALAACPPGLVLADGAHCCWPGQTFSPERGVCAGTPQCPPGLAAWGEGCVMVTAPAPQPTPAPAYLAPAPAAVLQTFPFRFESKEEEHSFYVSVDGGPSCPTPCSIAVTAGVHRVLVVEGEHSFTEKVRFPASPATVKVDRRHGDRIGVAATSLAVGIPVAIVGAYCVLYGALFSTVASSDTSDDFSRAGQGLIVGGGIAIVGGATLAAVGGSWGLRNMGRNTARVDGRPQRAEAPLYLEGLAVAPTRGGAVVGATLRF